jgi:hypothetical protein
MDNTKKLEKYLGQYVRVNYNVAKDAHKPSVMFGGKLVAYKTRYYEIKVTGGTWLVFTDENILNMWNETENDLYIEIG